MPRLARTLAGRRPFPVWAATATTEHKKAGPERYRSRNRRLIRSIDSRAAACLAQVASHRAAVWDESRSAHPKPCPRTAAARGSKVAEASVPDSRAMEGSVDCLHRLRHFAV